MFYRLVRYYETLPSIVKLLGESLGIALPFYASALLSVYIEKTAQLQGMEGVLLHVAIFATLSILVLVILKTLALVRNNLRWQEQRKREAIAYAHSLTDRWITEKIEHLDVNAQQFARTNSTQFFIEGFVASNRNIRLLVDSLYHVFESHFADSQNLESAIEFEVTFMTRSYIDRKITIPAWANKDNRAPRSLILRKENPSIYEATVAAQVYRAPRPEAIVTEDTLESPDYQELYPGQKHRIRSAIVYPVLSHRNELLGTLVVHCNSPHFFSWQSLFYWKKLLEIFAKRVALEKMKMDLLYTNLQHSQVDLSSLDLPF